MGENTTSTKVIANRNMRLGIVVSKWYYEEITSKMLEVAQSEAKDAGVEGIHVIEVPGSFDIPLAVLKLLQKEDVDGVITLGAVIQGSTKHDEVICNALTKTLMDLSLSFEIPVVLGINGPGMTKEQAIARIDRAGEVTKACIEMVNQFPKEKHEGCKDAECCSKN